MPLVDSPATTPMEATRNGILVAKKDIARPIDASSDPRNKHFDSPNLFTATPDKIPETYLSLNKVCLRKTKLAKARQLLL